MASSCLRELRLAGKSQEAMPAGPDPAGVAPGPQAGQGIDSMVLWVAKNISGDNGGTPHNLSSFSPSDVCWRVSQVSWSRSLWPLRK